MVRRFVPAGGYNSMYVRVIGDRRGFRYSLGIQWPTTIARMPSVRTRKQALEPMDPRFPGTGDGGGNPHPASRPASSTCSTPPVGPEVATLMSGARPSRPATVPSIDQLSVLVEERTGPREFTDEARTADEAGVLPPLVKLAGRRLDEEARRTVPAVSGKRTDPSRSSPSVSRRRLRRVRHLSGTKPALRSRAPLRPRLRTRPRPPGP